MKDFLQQIIKEAGYLAKGYYHAGVAHTFKSDPSDVVTEADIEVNRFLIDKILQKYPNHGVISEETKSIRPEAEYVWVIDPIDGTRNFSRHIGVWCVMIGIAKAGRPYMGAVYDALNDELFFAQARAGAFLNGNKISVSNYQKIDHCMISYSGGVFDANSPYNPDNFAGYQKFYQNLVAAKGHWVHNPGSMLTVCHLAAGRIDAVAKNSGLYHDILAPYVIATEAGAKFTDSVGRPWQKGRKDIVAANPVLHSKLMKLFL